ncbi:MAG: protein translocase subunit SecF [Calditrichaeota bacterium]|nr:protein translocase subunit SecF [Calditrichota bacterium]
MQIFKNTNFNIVAAQKKVFITSSIIVVLAVIWISAFGVQKGIDFTGGVQIILSFDKDINIDQIRTIIQNSDFSKADVKTYGDAKRIALSMQSTEDKENNELINSISSLVKTELPDYKLIEDPSVSNISAKMSQEIIGRSFEAIEYALVLIALYIIVRFSSRHTVLGLAGFIVDYLLYKFVWVHLIGVFIPLFVLWPIFKAGFAFGALAATFHDVVMTVSILEISNIEFSFAIVAALLTIIGYSLNDTIVVFDRIRDNIADIKPSDFKLEEFRSIVNRSINDTLNRTIITSLTTFFVVFILSIFGGESLFPFAFALSIGVIVGTYSSIFIAAPIMMNRFNAEMTELKEKEELEKGTKQTEESKNKILV